VDTGWGHCDPPFGGRPVTRHPADPDLRLLRRAARTVGAQTAAAVAAVVLAMAGAVLVVDEHQQHQQADTVSHSAWATADDVKDPPADTWLFIDPPTGPRQLTAGTPSVIAGLDPAALPDGRIRIVRQGREFVIFTGSRRIGRVSAVYGMSTTELEEHRLQFALSLAALIGVIGAGAIGALIGRRAIRPLGQAMALQRRFVADASHELRTPLSVLLLRAQLLRRHLEGTITPERRAELDRLVLDTKALSDVVSDLLLSAELAHRPQGGERVDLAALAVDLAESLRPLAAQRSIELTSEFAAASRPGEATSLIVNGAPAALRRALSSLVDNAIAHSRAGGQIRIRAARDGDLLTLAVIDDGEGLDPGQSGRLVERFSRGTSNGAGRRFGLGLSLVDEVARAHGGSLRVEGEPGAGAAFTLTLPAAP
jgi:signal transduction histidine kinase